MDLPSLEFHLLGGSSVGRVAGLAEFSVAVFLFLPFPAAMSDLSMRKQNSVSFLQHCIRPLFFLTKTLVTVLFCVFTDSLASFPL